MLDINPASKTTEGPSIDGPVFHIASPGVIQAAREMGVDAPMLCGVWKRPGTARAVRSGDLDKPTTCPTCANVLAIRKVAR